MSLDALLVVSLAFFVWGCQQERPLADAPLLTVPDNAMGTQIDSGVANAEAYLSPTAVLARIALTLTGSRPSVDALEDVHRHPERLATWVDRYLEDERFGRVIREMYNEVFSLRAFLMLFAPKAPVDDGRSVPSMNRRSKRPCD